MMIRTERATERKGKGSGGQVVVWVVAVAACWPFAPSRAGGAAALCTHQPIPSLALSALPLAFLVTPAMGVLYYGALGSSTFTVVALYLILTGA
jgi:hypothetical protein